jgi:hypothetical protein
MPVPDYDVFVEGEIVMLPIGGPALMVVETCDDCGEVETVYADSNNDLVFNQWPAGVLLRVQ